MVIAGVLAFGGLVLPYIVVPMRRAAGLPTYQWDSNTATNPVRSPFCCCCCCCCCCCSAPPGSSWRSPCRLPAGAAGPPTFRAPRLSPSPLSPLGPLPAHVLLRSLFPSGASTAASTALTTLRCWPSGRAQTRRPCTGTTTPSPPPPPPFRALPFFSLSLPLACAPRPPAPLSLTNCAPHTPLPTAPLPLRPLHCREARERLETKGKLL